MKIRRKAPKPPPSAHPLYVVGYRGAAPAPGELAIWFDLEYGGPLKGLAAGEHAPSPFHATHGPWDATIQLELPPTEAEAWQTSLAWSHPHASLVTPVRTVPGKAADLVLHAARLARGVTLLTGGTAYDVRTGDYLNPSDWQDRPLTHFFAGDHVTVGQADADETGCERFYTKGLTKFGLDELETFRPLGLSGRPVLERLASIAEAVILLGQSPKVGTSLPLPGVGLTLAVAKHRTVPDATGPVPFREIAW